MLSQVIRTAVGLYLLVPAAALAQTPPVAPAYPKSAVDALLLGKAPADFARGPGLRSRALTDRTLDRVSILEAAACDGTDETARINAFLADRSKVPVGSRVYRPAGRTCYVTNLVIPAGVAWDGDFTVPANPAGSNTGVELATAGAILLEKTGTVSLGGASAIRNELIVRADGGLRMPLPSPDASAYAGDCITPITPTGSGADARGPDGYAIENVLCVGQARALVSFGASRAYVNRFAFDANPGSGRVAVTVAGSYDSLWLNLRGWPYGTSQAAGRTLRRVGTGLLLATQNDDTTIDNATLVGYDHDVDFQGTGNIVARHIWTDSVLDGGVVVPGSTGIRIAGSNNVNILSFQSFGHETGIEVDAGADNRVSFGIGRVEGAFAVPVKVTSGNVRFGDLTVRSKPGPVLSAVRPALAIASGASFVSGSLHDEMVDTGPPVLVPPGYTTDRVRGLTVTAPYRPAGTPVFGGHPIVFPTIAAADPLLLPAWSDEVRLSGVAGIGTIGGCWGGRRYTIKWLDGGVLYAGPSITLLAGASSRKIAAGAISKLECDIESGKSVETGYFTP